MQRCTRLRPPRSGFTLPELLFTLATLVVLFVVVTGFVTEVDRVWKSAAEDSFAEAGDGFETMAKNLAAATLESYQDYADASGAFRTGSSFVPDHLARRSDLAFVCGPASGTTGLLASSGLTTTGSGVFFVAPGGYTQTFAHQGAARLLDATGYFVEFSDDATAPGFFVAQDHAWRWRLKQLQQSSEALGIFANPTSAAWIQQAVPAGAVIPVLVENVVTLMILPERAASDTGNALAPTFSYDSRDASHAITLHQLPPRVRLVLVAMDTNSALHLAALNGSTPPALVPAGLFQQAAQLDADLAALDQDLTTQKIGHRIFQREISLPASTWSNTSAP